jgi:acetoacetyl-CoA reductase
MKIDLNNRIALVLGGTTTVGTAICKQLAHSGARVVTDYVDTNIEAWKETLNADNVQVTAYQVDITDFDACIRLVENIEENVGPIDIIVNSPELSSAASPFHMMDKDSWDRTMTTNIDAIFNICKNLAEKMSTRGFGRIINISSIISRMGQSGHTHDAAAKAGLHGFTMALAQELARKGVTVNTITPGYMASLHPSDQSVPANIPAGRAGNPDEIASLVDYLCSDHASYINGADIAINGGQYMH